METSENSQLIWKALDQLRGSLDAQDAELLLLTVTFLRCTADAPEAATPESKRPWQRLVAEANYLPGLARALETTLASLTLSHPDGGERLIKSIPDHRLTGSLLAEVIRLIDRAEQPLELYEECLERFSHIKSAGNYFTPRSLVRLLVELLAPQPGERVFDPACGSGGFLVESARHVRERYGPQAEVGLAGRDINPRAWEIAWMNLTARRLKADLGGRPVDSLGLDDGADSDTFDVVLANPPFNLKYNNDLRRRHWRYGQPPKSNANFAWAQHVVSKLARRGRAAILLPDGATFTAGSARLIREGLVCDDILSAVVALPTGLFPHTGVKSSVWIFNREKPEENRGQVLFVNAREQGTPARSRRRTFSEDDIARIVDTYRSWSGNNQDKAGWCRSASVAEIAAQEFNLDADRYVGSPSEDLDPQHTEQRVAELTRELFVHFEEAARLEDQLRDLLGQM
ncbi:N-6 DNA methylase [Streptomyces sp. NPDC056149]|uniref:N-6 DNA methylase n=1 Tax=Streptomyces sp. NPDC056149 TaxID=3345728 RepID=UPI0035DFB1A2